LRIGVRESHLLHKAMMNADVAILGGGPNGLAMALALAGRKVLRPLSVALLDLRDPRHIPQDSRGTAITTATQNMFKALGLWPALADKAAEMRSVIVTDGSGDHTGRPSLLNFETSPGEKAAAVLVENTDLIAALVQEVQASPAISVLGGFSFASLHQTTGHVSVSANDGRELKSRLLIAADGRNSKLRDAAGISVVKKDYGQTALSFSIRHEGAHNNLAEEHFSPDGVFAVLPLHGNRASIVWGTFPETAGRLMSLSDQDFNSELQNRMGQRLGTVMLDGQRGSYPLARQIADCFVSDRVALIGDAAHAIHPLAGLGLNLGFKDAAVLADLVAAAVSRGEDFGGASCLAKYETARRAEVQFTSLGMDGMNALFVNDNPALKILRGLGLRAVDQLAPVKSLLMQQASGLSQNNPRLMRGLLPG
jgi:2-octaprenyl-6-methoxyphenol hydroxylase